MPFLLLTDIHSSVNPSVKYGSRFDAVTIVSRFGHVLIVADKRGNRYATGQDNVLEVSDQEMKRVSEVSTVLRELQDKSNTIANAQRVKVQEEKIMSIINQ